MRAKLSDTIDKLVDLPNMKKTYSIRSAGKGLSVIERWDESPELRKLDLDSPTHTTDEEFK